MSRYCVILCGGPGSRLWPGSRAASPKQFADFMGTGRSLLQMTFDRVSTILPPENIYLLTNVQYVDLVHGQLPQVPAQNILAEPGRRNTAPSIAWAAHRLAASDADASMLVVPSDQLVTRESAFLQAVQRGYEFVEANDALLTLGVKPIRPETAYGYIQTGPEKAPGIYKVKTFTEKPDATLAETFVRTGEFYWNSGIFMWQARHFLEALAITSPNISAAFERGCGLYGTPQEDAFIAHALPSCLSVPVDYAVLERATNVYVETVDFGWSDLGTWHSLYEASPKDRSGNVTQGCQVISYDCSGTYFNTLADKLVVAQDLHDFVVADTGDVLLICPRTAAQDMRRIVNDVKMAYGGKFL